jgi:hypothetical protein
MAALAIVSSGGSAYASVPPSLTSFQLNADATGGYINVRGNVITGAQTNASVSYSPTESSNATGEGVFLTSTGADGKASVSLPDANNDTSLTNNAPAGGALIPGLPSGGGPTNPPCNQGGGRGAGPFNVALGFGCASASGSIDPNPAGLSAGAASHVAEVAVDASPLLNQLAGGGATKVCTGLTSVPVLGNLLGQQCQNVLTSLSPTVDVTIGSAYSTVTTSASQLQAKASASTIDVKLFPVAATGGNEPLIEVTIPSATASTTYDAASGTWSNSSDCASPLQISGTLVDDIHTVNNSFPDPVRILPCNSASALNAVLQNPQLAQVVSVDLGSASSTSGSGANAEGFKVTLLGGGSSGITIDTAGVGTSETSSGGEQTTTTLPPPPLPPVQTQVNGFSPTAVHTGEWWAGSLPLLAVLVALGGGLLGWPRLRRLPILARLLSRGSR